MASKQWVIAGTAEQARQFARCKQWRTWEWDYIVDIEELRLIRGGSTILLVGTYYERKDYDEISDCCEHRDIGLVQV